MNNMMRRLLKSAARDPGQLDDLEFCEDLVAAWRNPWSDADFVHASVALAKGSPGKILECGSGLTTLVLGCIPGLKVLSLEENYDWYGLMTEALRHVPHPPLLLDAPLLTAISEEHNWYLIPETYNWMDFDAVIVDGPSSVSGDLSRRAGLMAVMGDQIRPGAHILMDDTGRDGVRSTINTWISDYGMTGICNGDRGHGMALLVR